ncbi:hypothetical protein SISNIDRAFT_463363 [Sistotremastrum niveocremeum HHB9708]|uniref:Uncharacterized protein n=1 Tax=Sistotremastrum niveocremeum HHB9708 TaxID=1314777 RepID=A0A164Z2J9_9AGAM|nr:hypothetical protein SISNIDRAFT_463363 [Sistotremastrum niveocremeum HHB9708]
METRRLDSSFPSEMLGMIFGHRHEDIFYAQMEPACSEFRGYKDYQCLRDLFDLTHVCSRWREIALANPALWATISLSWPMETIEMFIERAKAVGLRFFLNLFSGPRPRPNANNMTTDELETRGALISRHVPRIHEIYLHDRRELDHIGIGVVSLPISDLSSLYLPIVNSEAPTLKKVTIMSDRRSSSPIDDNKIQQLFLRHAPNLTHVRLKGVHIKLYDAPFTALTTLHLSTRGREEILYALKDIPVILAQFPSLEELHLTHPYALHPLDSVMFDDQSTYTHIVLPYCKVLQFSGMHTSQMLYLLENIKAPSLQSLRMLPADYIHMHPEESLLPNFPSWLHGFLRDVPSLDIAFQAGRVYLEFEFERDEVPCNWKFQLRKFPDVQDLNLWLTKFKGNLDILNPEELHVTQGPLWGSGEYWEPSLSVWRGILETLTRLRVVTAGLDNWMNNFFLALGDEDGFCPSLEEIEIHGAQFDGDSVRRMLMRRQGNGQRLKKLVLDIEPRRFRPKKNSDNHLLDELGDQCYQDPLELVDEFVGDTRFFYGVVSPPPKVAKEFSPEMLRLMSSPGMVAQMFENLASVQQDDNVAL